MSMTVITGASSGLGRSLARRIAATGEPVALLARRQDLLESLRTEIEQAGGTAVALPCDVTDPAAVRAAVQRAEAWRGPTTTLIANAGGALTATAPGHFSAAHIAAVVDLNLTGVAHCIEAVLPGMVERRAGHLVAVSSLAGYRGLPASAAYSAAKAALTNMMESLRIDLRGSGVDVSILAPGFVRTKPGQAKKKNRPFRLELEPATALMHRAIQERRPFYAFPLSLVLVSRLGWMMPAAIYDRVLAGRGPKVKT